MISVVIMKKPNLSREHLERLLEDPSRSAALSENDLPKLETELAEKDDPLSDTVLRLSDYLAAVEMVIKETFNHHVWVKAEIRNLSTKGGHYYFELAEKDDSGKVVASCRGNLWRFKAARVLGKFERETGMSLDRDVTVLLKVSATFHPQYGFSLAIEDIDPSYTLGDLARQYAAMVERLAGEGLLNLNQTLPAPFDIEHVLVIAPENAAGLGDFQADADKLSQTRACHFHYHHATFQGNHAPSEIRAAIHQAQQQFAAKFERLPDLLVIIRGGGAVGDLAYLNDYELAALVAEQPVPVWVGIGHERDHVILDEVAHSSFDTPSKVIAAISAHLARLVAQTRYYEQQIQQSATRAITLARSQSERQFSIIQAHANQSLIALKKDCNYAWQSIGQSAKQQLRQSRYLALSAKQSIEKQAFKNIQMAKRNSQFLRDSILLYQPSRVLNQGFARITNEDGAVTISQIDGLHASQQVQLHLKDGIATATINGVCANIQNSK